MHSPSNNTKRNGILFIFALIFGMSLGFLAEKRTEMNELQKDPVPCGWYVDPTLEVPDNYPKCGRTRASACRTIDRAINALFINNTLGIRGTINLCLLGRRFEVNESVTISPPPDRPVKWVSGSTLRLIPDNQLDPSQFITISGSKQGSFTFKNITQNVTIAFDNLIFDGFEMNTVLNVQSETRVQIDDSIFIRSYRAAEIESGGHVRFSNTQFNGGGRQNSSFVAKVKQDSAVHFESNCRIVDYNTDVPVISVKGNSRLHFYASTISNCKNSAGSPVSVTLGSSFQLKDKSVFTGNVATLDGGLLSGIGCGTGCIISNSIFSNNNAVNGRGGAVFCSDSPSLKVESSSFDSNTAQNGGGIAIFNTKVRIWNSQFKKNIGSTRGGGVWLSTNVETKNNTLGSCLFDSNVAPIGAQISMTDFGDRGSWRNITVIGTLKNAVDCEGSDVCKPCGGSCKYCEGACIRGDNKEVCYSSKGFLCGDHGECVLNNEVGFECDCQTGWQGPLCDVAPGKTTLLLIFAVCFFAMLLGVTGFVLVWMWKRLHMPTEPEGEPFLPSSPHGKGRWRPKRALI
eukprot:TRINITY_DN3700_c1_g1_i1.p1 TRINITY_DN3700_c1_g1~~TRINITY_DN3700_c1_g1_i1.p1  ORF type:complete len:571 (+),score=193.76 TRINITY_DN3700_c1_g1_i1:145-1857(+)